MHEKADLAFPRQPTGFPRTPAGPGDLTNKVRVEAETQTLRGFQRLGLPFPPHRFTEGLASAMVFMVLQEGADTMGFALLSCTSSP